MKTISNTFALFLILTICSGCSSDSSPRSTIKVFNSLADSTVINVRIDGSEEVSGLRYGQISEQFSEEEGTKRIRIEAPGIAQPILDRPLPINSDYDYIVYIAGRIAETEMVQRLRDDITPPEDRLRLQFGVLAPGVKPVDVYILRPEQSVSESIPAETNLRYKDFSIHYEIPQGLYQIAFVDSKSGALISRTATIPFDKSESYTFIVIESPGGGAPYTLALINQND